MEGSDALAGEEIDCRARQAEYQDGDGERDQEEPSLDEHHQNYTTSNNGQKPLLSPAGKAALACGVVRCRFSLPFGKRILACRSW
jgi:hypothetical protein